MANELNVTAGLSFVKANATRNYSQASDTDGSFYIMTIVDASDVPKPLFPEGSATLGMFWGMNKDPATSIHLRIGETGANFITFKPNDCAVFRLASRDVWIVADGPQPGLEFLVVEDA